MTVDCCVIRGLVTIPCSNFIKVQEMKNCLPRIKAKEKPDSSKDGHKGAGFRQSDLP
jgi:hypothetical protein